MPGVFLPEEPPIWKPRGARSFQPQTNTNAGRKRYTLAYAPGIQLPKLTLAVWARPQVRNTSGVRRCIFHLKDSAYAGDRGCYGLSTVPTAQYHQIYFVAGSTTAHANSTGITYAPWNQDPPKVWHHFAGTLSRSGGNSMAAWLNGVAATASTSSNAHAGVDHIAVGGATCAGAGDTTSDNGWDGDLAHACAWTVVLDAAEIRQLARGVHPLAIRRDDILFYAPLDGAPGAEADWASGSPLLVPGGAPGRELYNGPQLRW